VVLDPVLTPNPPRRIGLASADRAPTTSASTSRPGMPIPIAVSPDTASPAADEYSKEERMKIKAAILGVALIVMTAGAANAGSWWIGGHGGVGFPTGDYGNVASTGWNLGLTGTNMVNENWGFGGDLGYHSWGGSNDMNAVAETLYGPGSSWSWSAIQATGHATYAFSTTSNVKPFAHMGLGLYSISAKLDSPSGNATDSQSKLGFNLGGGVNFATHGNRTWGFDGTYHVIPADGTNVDTFSLGLHVLWGMTK
jgi:outer membrane protein with beta-barrel domain